MRVRFGIPLLCSALAATAFGCTSKVATVTMFSTRNVDMSQSHDRLPRAKESDSRLWLLFIPLGGAPSGLQAAVDLIEDKDADYLTNVDVTEGGWSLLAISRGWVTVEADPWHSPGPAPAARGSGDADAH
jgi:hypothetical protein